jgi:excisionase family DNA binding protein
MNDEWLSLGQAAALSGLERQTLRELLRSGRLPGIRQQGRWRIARADLAALGERRPSGPGRGGPNRASSAVSGEQAQLAMILREREAEIRRLQDERLQMARLIGFLQARVMERDARIAVLEARALPETVPVAHDHQDELLAAVAAAEAPPAPPPVMDGAANHDLPPVDPATPTLPVAARRPRGIFALLSLFGRRA